MEPPAPAQILADLDAFQQAVEWGDETEAERLSRILAEETAGRLRHRAHFAVLTARRVGATDADRTAAHRLCAELGDPDLLAASLALAAPGTSNELVHSRLERAIELLPDDAPSGIRAFVLYMYVVLNLHRLERGVLELARRLVDVTGPGEALAVRSCIALSLALCQLGRWREAIVWCDEGLEIATRPSLPRGMVLVRRAALAVLEGDPARAAQAVDAALPLLSAPRARATAALVLPHLGRHAEAARMLDEVRETAGDTGWVDLYAAFLALHRGDVAAMVRLTPDVGADASESIVQTVTLLRHAAAARPRVDDLERATRVYGADPDIERLLGEALARRDDPWDAGSVRIRRLLHDHRAMLGRPEGFEPAPDGAPVPVGPYDLFERIGAGACGTVWLARHHASGATAAVKILHDTGAEALEREAMLVARLRHPHVVGVLGVGRLDVFAAKCRPDAFRAGQAWLAMEAVTGGTLEPWCGALPWDAVRRVLLALLEGLGHAHAHGALHLDLKPANVLLEQRDAEIVPKLADFGVASLLGALDDGARRVAGTPYFMAPEQWRGALHELGPWTDLYALGCLAWALLTGLPPFLGDDFRAIAALHLRGPRPPLPPAPGAPDGVEAWLHRLLDVSPTARFQSAAAAAAALEALGVGAGSGVPTGVASATDAPTEMLTATLRTFYDPQILALVAAGGDRAAVPASWPRQPATAPVLVEPAIALVRIGGGGLHGLDAEKAALWDALRRVSRAETAHVVRLEPMPGATARALTTWLCERAREAGIPAHVLDLADPAWPDAAVGACVQRSGLGDRNRVRALQARFPTLSPGVVHDPTPDEALRVLRADLGLGPSVLVVRGPPDERLNASLALQPCLVVVEEPGTEVHQRLAVPHTPAADIARTLVERVPVAPHLADALAALGGGYHDPALAALRELVASDALEYVGNAWHLRAGRRLPTRAVTLPGVAMARFLAASPDAALVAGAHLAGLTLADARCATLAAALGGDPVRAAGDLRALGLLDAEGGLVAGARGVAADWAGKRSPRIEASASAVSMGPRDRARVIVQAGRPADAVELLVGLAADAPAGECAELLDAAVDIAADHPGLELPGEYHLLRAVAVRYSDPPTARRYLLLATRDPATASRAHDGIATLPDSTAAESEAHLVEALRFDPGHPKLVMKLAVMRARQGRTTEAIAMIREALERDPTSLDLRYGLFGLQWQTRPDATWLEGVAALAEEASERPGLGPLVWVLTGFGGIQSDRPDLVARARSHLTDEHRALLDVLEAVARDDEAAARETLAGVHATYLQTRLQHGAIRIWLAVRASPALWAETLARHPADAPVDAGSRWILEHALAHAEEPTRRAVLRGMLERRTLAP